MISKDQDPASIQAPLGAAFEQHFSVKQIAQKWGLGVDTIRKLFAHEEGVIRIAHPEVLHKRGYMTLKIPESVVKRVHRKLTQIRSERAN